VREVNVRKSPLTCPGERLLGGAGSFSIYRSFRSPIPSGRIDDHRGGTRSNVTAARVADNEKRKNAATMTDRAQPWAANALSTGFSEMALFLAKVAFRSRLSLSLPPSPSPSPSSFTCFSRFTVLRVSRRDDNRRLTQCQPLPARNDAQRARRTRRRSPSLSLSLSLPSSMRRAMQRRLHHLDRARSPLPLCNDSRAFTLALCLMTRRRHRGRTFLLTGARRNAESLARARD